MTGTKTEEILCSLPESWKSLLQEEINKPYYQDLVKAVSKEYETTTVYPPVDKVFEALNYVSPDQVKVVILGQDPYFNPEQANGLAFSVSDGIKLPPSLVNIYKELYYEYGYYIPRHNGDLSPWASQGVLLLNTTLTVRGGEANSHSRLGWTKFTDAVIKALDSLNTSIVYLLWGNPSFAKAKLIHSPNASIIHTAHPSPLSASRGFFHSSCFIQVNQCLSEHGLKEIDWQIKEK